MFKPVDPKVSFPRLEAGILDFWKKEEIFRRSVEERSERRPFIFYEGPPTANARPGIHHVLARVFKDLVPRYKTMQGYRVPRKAGWDTHGLPVELEIERELGLQSKLDIEAYGIAAFNAKCKESVSRYVDEWTRLSERIGFWADLEHPYVTWHNDYIESCWWIFKEMWEHGLVYQDYRVTPHCPRCGTSLSDHEVSLGYEDDTPDPSIFPKFKVVADEASARALGLSANADAYLVAWTTTPWTLPGNVALAVKEDADYGIYEHDGQYCIVATALAEKVLGERASHLATVRGDRLVGLKYEPLYRPELLGHDVLRFDHEGRLRPVTDILATDGLRRVVPADYVSLDDGTGIVHTATAFGAEDFEEGKVFRLLFVQPVDLRGIMAEGLPGAGKFVKQADRDIIRDLEERGLMLKSGTMKHTYPFCWRCHTPLLYYAKPSWYIRTTKQKESLLEGNDRIHWYPDHIQHGRFGNWLENNIDWAVSRERYWGTPLPFWKCEACGQATCVGSRAELAERAIETEEAAAMDDLHRPFIDEITLRCTDCQGVMRRVPEVADAWFDSGAMPYAQWHYPFENVEEFEKSFPADYICEAIDQTRGWFYTLHAEATLLKASEAVPDSISFKNVIVLGHIQDEKGNKMSKSRGNAADPWPVLDQHGADATRWYMYTASPAGSSRRFSSALVEEGLRRFLLTLWNTYSFFVSYANIDEVDPRTAPSGTAPEIDRWLLSELNVLVEKVTDELDVYDPTDAARAIEAFVEDMSNWYVRRSRRRFWRGVSESDDDKQSAYYTLYTALVTLSKLLAPFTPFIAEELWQNLVRSLDTEAPDSVHLAPWPKAILARTDTVLMDRMRSVKKICSLGRAARARANLKLRMPVSKVIVSVPTGRTGSVEARVLARQGDLIREELNAEVVEFAEGLEFPVQFRARLNLPRLGPRLGAQLAILRPAVEGPFQHEAVEAARTRQPLVLPGFDVVLEPDDLLLESEAIEGYSAATDSGFSVAVDIRVSDELKDKGLAREIVRRLQDMRREAGFDLADRITTWYSSDGDVARVARSHAAYIQAETLSTDLVGGDPPAGAHRAEQDLEGVKVVLAVRRNA
jgi:isoleucyl-tRNA synthetase